MIFVAKTNISPIDFGDHKELGRLGGPWMAPREKEAVEFYRNIIIFAV